MGVKVMKKNNQSILSHFLTIASGSFISMIISAITTPVITRLISISSYGKYSLYSVYVNVALFIFCMGMDQVIIRYFYEDESNEYRRSLISKCWIIPGITLTIFSLFFIIIKNIFNLKFGESNFYLILLFLGVLSQILYRISLIIVRLQYKSKRYALITSLHKFIFLIVSVILVCSLRSDNEYLLIISFIIASICPTIIAIMSEKSLWKIKIDNNIIKSKEIIKYGIPFIISSGVYIFYNAADKICINFFKGEFDVGIYASATNLMGVFGIVQTTFSSLWYPMALEKFTKKPDDKSFHEKGCNVITIIMFVFGISIIMFKDLIIFFLGKNYREAVYLIPFLSFYPIMYTISEATVHGIDFYKKNRLHMYISIISLIFNLFGNILLIPIFGRVGAAISTGISYILFFTLRTFFSLKYFKVNYHLKRIYILIIITFIFAIYSTFVPLSYIHFIYYVLELLAIFVLYKNNFKDFKMILKEKFKKKGDVIINE